MKEGDVLVRRQPLEIITPDITAISDDSELLLEDEEKPLTAASLGRGRSPGDVGRRLTAKFKDFIADKEEEVSCFGSMWRGLASAVLTFALVSPFLYSLYKHAKINLPNYPSDLQSCAVDKNFSFAALHRQIQGSLRFCPQNYTRQSCHCSNPFKPVARVPRNPEYFLKWDSTLQRNIRLAESFADEEKLKVVFYGDSITEHWLGTDLGAETQEAMSVNHQFQSIFKDGEALALGLAGDRVSCLRHKYKCTT